MQRQNGDFFLRFRASNRLPPRDPGLGNAGSLSRALVETNPTRLSLTYPEGEILGALSVTNALRYEPSPLGLWAARVAVAAHVSRHRDAVGPERIVLTASTSEAYALLCKVCCAAGESAAMPRPSYPLLPVLAHLEGVQTLSYALHWDGLRFCVDLAGVRGALDQGARLVAAVSPNNPTGTVLTQHEALALATLCAEYEVPLVVDEVFGCYGYDSDWTRGCGNELPGLVIVLEGLSKTAALPQLKLGWMVVRGDEGAARELIEALEFAADAYLSVATPVQLGAARLLELGEAVQGELRERLRMNLALLRREVARVPALSVVAGEGGFTALVRMPRIVSDATLVTEIGRRAGLLVQPGAVYDFVGEGWLVLSLASPPAEFAAAAAKLAEALGTWLREV